MILMFVSMSTTIEQYRENQGTEPFPWGGELDARSDHEESVKREALLRGLVTMGFLALSGTCFMKGRARMNSDKSLK